MYTIMIPAITLPLFVVLLLNYFKAQKLGLIPTPETARSPLQSLIYYARQFDALGLFLMSAGFALFLLPFNLYTLQAQGWTSPLVISMLAVGTLLILLSIIWERYFAPTTFIPYTLLRDRTVLGACLLSFTLFASYFAWSAYFSSFLQVVYALHVDTASYVVQTYTVTSVVCAVAVGALIHYTGRFKPACLYLALPLSVLGLGLMMHFRRPGTHVGYAVLCQLLISVAAGTVVICDEIAILAAASHQHVAVCLAVLGLFGNIGGAVGLTVAAAIWQDTLPKKLAAYLPVDELVNLDMIYADIVTQLSYPVGSDTRTAIQMAYGDAQLRMVAAGMAFWAVGLVAVLMWRDINVLGIKQTKGHVW